MAIKLTDRGAVKILRRYFKGTPCSNTLGLAHADNLMLRLYINNISLDDSNTTGTYAGTSPNETFTHSMVNEGSSTSKYIINGVFHTPHNDDGNGGTTNAGYFPKELLASSFVVEIYDNIARARYPQVQFNFGGPLIDMATIRGYYVTDAAGELIYAEAASVGFQPTQAGDAILFTPVFQLSSGIPT